MADKTIVATVTGTAGPGSAVTAGVFTNLRSVRFDNQNMLELVDNNGKVTNLSIAAATTFTVTVSSGNYVVVVS
jgi:hypothetical protein